MAVCLFDLLEPAQDQLLAATRLILQPSEVGLRIGDVVLHVEECLRSQGQLLLVEVRPSFLQLLHFGGQVKTANAGRRLQLLERGDVGLELFFEALMHLLDFLATPQEVLGVKVLR